MATATTATRRVQRKDVKEFTYLWEGFDRNNRNVRGEMKAASETVVTTNLRRQGIRIVSSIFSAAGTGFPRFGDA